MAPASVRVTIVIPVYNGGNLLARMLDSILVQSEKSFEVLCVDDGSSDSGVTANVLQTYSSRDSRIRVLRQENRGPAAARNLGLLKACGKYVYICDQDDFLHPQLLEYCLWVAEGKNVSFVAFKYAKHGSDTAPSIDSLGDFANIPLVVADKALSKTDPAKYCRAHEFHTDCWVQFTTLELARSFPFSLDRGVTRPFTLLKNAGRWAVSDAVLYYYNPGVAISMMHKPISKKVLLAERSDWQAFWALYDQDRVDGDVAGLWKHQCRLYLIKGLKIELNAIRRSRRKEVPQLHREKLEILAESLREFFVRRKLPLRFASFKHAVKYLWLMSRYR